MQSLKQIRERQQARRAERHGTNMPPLNGPIYVSPADPDLFLVLHETILDRIGLSLTMAEGPEKITWIGEHAFALMHGLDEIPLEIQGIMLLARMKEMLLKARKSGLVPKQLGYVIVPEFDRAAQYMRFQKISRIGASGQKRMILLPWDPEAHDSTDHLATIEQAQLRLWETLVRKTKTHDGDF